VNGTIEKQDTPVPKKAQKKARKDQQRQEHIAAEKKDAKKTYAVSAEGEPRRLPNPIGLSLL
jgi:hypothetical protein